MIVCPWMIPAIQQLGIREITGAVHNERILAYHATTTLAAKNDETHWCSAFVNWCFVQVGIVGTNSAAARSWLKWGREVPDSNWTFGDVFVLKRGEDPNAGHVGFLINQMAGEITLLGGNQGDMVSIKPFLLDRIIGVRRP